MSPRFLTSVTAWTYRGRGLRWGNELKVAGHVEFEVDC